MDAEALTLLRAIRDELRLMRGDLAQRSRDVVSAADRTLLAALCESCGDLAFGAGDVIEHSQLPGQEKLRMALSAAMRNPTVRRLGNRLRDLKDRELGEFAVVLVENDRDGAVWRVLRLSDSR